MIGMTTGIEWTDETWNPVTGCSKVSEGCRHCYAERVSHRFGWTESGWTARNAAQNVQLHPERLSQPLRWRKPRRIFVNSMSDLFHEQVPDEFIWHVFQIIADCPAHTFQILTKRPERMLEILQGRFWRNFGPSSRGGDFHALIIKGEQRESDVPFLPNVWLGVSVENQRAADERIPLLLQTPAAIRFLSCEPLLGSLDLGKWVGTYYCSTCGYRGFDGGAPDAEEGDDRCPCCGADSWYFTLAETHGALGEENRNPIQWVIVGGESGTGARPMHPDWARSLRDQCTESGVSFLFKQWGEWIPVELTDKNFPVALARTCLAGDGKSGDVGHWLKAGKKAAGRSLDGRVWDEYPQEATAK